MLPFFVHFRLNNFDLNDSAKFQIFYFNQKGFLEGASVQFILKFLFFVNSIVKSTFKEYDTKLIVFNVL